MIVVDGRTDFEKLIELLKEPEQECLEFKSTINMSDPKNRFDFLKDIMAIANNPEGGYILIGVNNQGVPCRPKGGIPEKQKFDSAVINDLSAKYSDGICKTTSQVHEVDGNEIIILYVMPHEDNLPLPFSKPGQYLDAEGKQVTVFRPGEIVVREGAQNSHLKKSHFEKLLSRFSKTVKDDAHKDIDRILSKLANEGILSASVSLELDMAEAVFVSGVRRALEQGATDSINRVILQAASSLVPGNNTYENSQQKLTLVACESLLVDNHSLCEKVIEIMYDSFLQVDFVRNKMILEHLLMQATHLYIIGSIAVRLSAWEIVKFVSAKEGTKMYSCKEQSWIRELQVGASRENLMSDNSGLMISLARKELDTFQGYRPDISELASADKVDEFDKALNSLCQFDLLYCSWVYARTQNERDAYPASAYYQSRRLSRITKLIASRDDRSKIFSNLSDNQIAQGIEMYFNIAEIQARTHGNYWFDSPSGIVNFLESVRSRSNGS